MAEPQKLADLLQDRYRLESLAPVMGVSTDSREVRPGDLYLPIIGSRTDGHLYAAQAASAGAVLILASRDLAALPSGTAVARVTDTTRELGRLARQWRQQFDLPMIGITGSNGKTTTKDMAAAMLQPDYHLLYSEQSYNSTIGLPMTLLRLGHSHDLALVEMGTNQPGEIAYLADIARPTLGLVTNVSASHVALLGDEAGVAAEKGALFEALPSDGVALVNAADSRVAAMPAPGRRYTYQLFPGQLFPGQLDPEPGTDLDLAGWYVTNSGQPRLRLEAPGLEARLSQYGQTLAQNALAAAALALLLKVQPEQILSAIEAYQVPAGRGRICRFGETTVIDDSYNANPASTRAGLDTLLSLPGRGRRLAVLADMLELGPAAAGFHREIGAYAAQLGVERLFCYGPQSRATCEGALAEGLAAGHYADMDGLVQALRESLQEGDLVYFKGSRGMALETAITELFGDAAC